VAEDAPLRFDVSISKRQLSKNQLGKIRREIQDLEEEISLLEADLEVLGQRMSRGELSSAQLATAAQDAGRLETTLAAKMKRWEELNRLMERG
jgi:predicted RNase H-like nuclease (RuvC/YqgF family)